LGLLLVSLFFLEAQCSVASLRAEAAANNLIGQYKNGEWASALWWQNANVLVATLHYGMRTKNTTFYDIIPKVYAVHKDFNIEGFDDEGWWGLAWIEAYKATQDKTYLSISERIFADLVTAWDNTCGGGVWWDRKRTYKNSVTNELFFAVAAGLYIQTKNQTYLDWAEKEWKWFSGIGLINQNHLINDGLSTSTCTNNRQTLWTYNQGVVLGGLVDLFRATGQQSFLTSAGLIANATFLPSNNLATKDQILQETCEPSKSCDGDQFTFKGIFMRNLGYLYDATKSPVYADIINKNADSIWNNARRTSDNSLGLYWSGPFDAHDAQRQSSALEALNAALLI